MTITSFGFLVLLAVGMILYYILPKSWQWVELLLMSLIFYWYAATPYTLIYIIIVTLITYLATNAIDVLPNRMKNKKNISKVVAFLNAGAVVVSLGFWLVIRGSDLWVSGSYYISRVIPFAKPLQATPLVAALGMGYYSFQIIAYIMDCYWGTIKPQKNPVKLFLFAIFFPQMITGPISRYQQMESLYEKHKFDYLKVTHGVQRILWGFFKKIVLAERVGIIVNAIWDAPETYTGLYLWVALLLYPIQMYADFSGCMDIVLGAAELFGIQLPENFNNPFFARTVQEFWQRWHITLGTWAKDYVLYPILKSKLMIRLGKYTKKKFGKRWGKLIPTILGMFLLWMVMGIWHGSFKYIIGVSLWYWIILMLGEICAPILQRINILLHIKQESFSWHLFQSTRTYFIYAVGAVFFRAPGLKSAVTFLKDALKVFQSEGLNMWILFDGSVLNTGITHMDLNIIVLAVLIMLVVAILRERYGYARLWMDQQVLVFRWLVWIGLFVFVLIYGMYGPGYDAAEFIYQGF